MTCVTVWLVNITISILEYDSPCFYGAVLYDKVCQFLGDRFLCTQVFSTNKINHLDISEIHVESGVKCIKSNPINPFNLHFMINNINISSKIVPLIFSAFYTVEFIFKTEFSIKGFSHTKKICQNYGWFAWLAGHRSIICLLLTAVASWVVLVSENY